MLTFVDRSSSLILNGSDELDHSTVVDRIVLGSGIGKSEEHAMQMMERARVIPIAVALCVASSMSVASVDEAAFLDAQSLIAGWKARYGGIRRMHFRLSDRVIDVNDNKGSVGLENLVRFQVADLTIDRDTKRFHLRYSRNEGGLDEPLKIHESAFNGKTTQQYWGDGPRRRGRISSGRIGTTPAILEASLRRYLLADSVGAPVDAQGREVAYMEWVSGMIGNTMESGKPCTVVKPNVEMVSGEPCHVLELVHGGKVMSKTWFAHDKGMLPMRFQMFLDDGKLGHEIVVLDTAKVETDTDATWYPSKATQMAIVGAHDNSGNIVYGTVTHQLQVFEFTPNVEVDESTFQFEFPAGTEVRDEVRGVDYTVPGK